VDAVETVAENVKTAENIGGSQDSGVVGQSVRMRLMERELVVTEDAVVSHLTVGNRQYRSQTCSRSSQECI